MLPVEHEHPVIRPGQHHLKHVLPQRPQRTTTPPRSKQEPSARARKEEKATAYRRDGGRRMGGGRRLRCTPPRPRCRLAPSWLGRGREGKPIPKLSKFRARGRNERLFLSWADFGPAHANPGRNERGLSMELTICTRPLFIAIHRGNKLMARKLIRQTDMLTTLTSTLLG